MCRSRCGFAGAPPPLLVLLHVLAVHCCCLFSHRRTAVANHAPKSRRKRNTRLMTTIKVELSCPRSLVIRVITSRAVSEADNGAGAGAGSGAGSNDYAPKSVHLVSSFVSFALRLLPLLLLVPAVHCCCLFSHKKTKGGKRRSKGKEDKKKSDEETKQSDEDQGRTATSAHDLDSSRAVTDASSDSDAGSSDSEPKPVRFCFLV